MKIYIDTPEAPGSKGSYRIVSDNINMALERRGLLASTDDELTHYGVCSSTYVAHKHPDKTKKNFYYCAWEVSTVPDYLVQWIGKDMMIGTAKWVEDCWNRSGYNNTSSVLLGCDVDFWKPLDNINKFDKFTILCHTTSNSRSGLDTLIPVFGKYFQNKNIRLYIKDRPNSKLAPFIENINKQYNSDIIYDTSDATHEELRILYNRCHAHIYPILCTGFGMTITQTLSCGIPNIVTNYSAPPEIVSEKVGYLIQGKEVPFTQAMVDRMQTIGIDNYIPMTHYKYQPYIFELDEVSIAKQIEAILTNYKTFKPDTIHQYIRENFSWDNTCDNLIKVLQELR
jgi:glycosyltransferase involved in cell wall biosynthesis